MSNQPLKFNLSARVAAPQSEVWSVVSDPKRADALVEGGLVAFLDYSLPDFVGGQVEINKIRFDIKLKPFDVRLVCRGLRIDLNITKSQFGSVASATVLIADPEKADYINERVKSFLNALADSIENKKVYRAGAPVETEVVVAEKRVRKTSRKAVVAVALVIVLVFGGLLGLFALRAPQEAPTADVIAGGGDVSFDKLEALALGTEKSQVSWLFGTAGEPQGGGVVYRSRERAANSANSAESVYVVYDANDQMNSYTYLNLNTCSNSSAIGVVAGEPKTGATLEEMQEIFGRSVSMIREYYNPNGEWITEYHFGYLDPFANFDPAWRGEYVVSVNRYTDELAVAYWGNYNGAHQYMYPQLASYPIENQFDTYSDFLDARYFYSRALLLLNKYSRGDLQNVFGGNLAEYGAGPGAILYTLETADTAAPEGAEDFTPPYRISVGLDSAGGFRLGSYTNLALAEREGQLDGSDYNGVTRGMAYGEIGQIMGVLPTAFMVDANSFTVCYGKHLESDVAEQQFEVVVRFDLETFRAQSVFINIREPAEQPEQQPAEPLEPATGE